MWLKKDEERERGDSDVIAMMFGFDASETAVVEDNNSLSLSGYLVSANQASDVQIAATGI